MALALSHILCPSSRLPVNLVAMVRLESSLVSRLSSNAMKDKDLPLHKSNTNIFPSYLLSKEDLEL